MSYAHPHRRPHPLPQVKKRSSKQWPQRASQPHTILATLLRDRVLQPSPPLTSAAARHRSPPTSPPPAPTPPPTAAQISASASASSPASTARRSCCARSSSPPPATASSSPERRSPPRGIFVPGEARRTPRFLAVPSVNAFGEARAMALFPEGVSANAVAVGVLHIDAGWRVWGGEVCFLCWER